jgi:quinohemoprotein ethanol dehydrogenase
MLKRGLFVLLACLSGLATLNLPVAAATPGAAGNWPNHGGDTDETDYSRLDQINTSSLSRLGLSWSLDLPGEVSLEATPLAVNGVLYFTGTYATVYAVDGTTGKVLWKYDPQTWKNNPFKMNFTFAVNRGAAYADGRIFSAALDGRLFALDARTGKLIWSVETTSPQSPQTVTGAPRVFNGKVIIGNAGADFGARGYVTAYDAATGRQLWRFYATPGTPAENKGDPAMERAAATWGGEYWKNGTGGAVWDGITFDKEMNRIYIATGNASPYDPKVRAPKDTDDNLYTCSIVALDADTGKYAWHYQVVPRDSWDFDATQQMTLADLAIDGKSHKVLMQAPKDGFLYVIDRQTGKLISAGKIGKVTWADHIDIATGRPVEAKNIHYETGDVLIWPGPMGAHGWMSMAFSPKTNLLYIPYMQAGVHFWRGSLEHGAVNVGGLNIKDHESDPEDGKGALVAYDPVQQKVVWKAQHDFIWNGGALATAGNLVFQGTADGNVHAYDAATGRRLWQFNAGLGIVAAPMSYMAGGKQYVALLVGYGGSSAIWGSLMNVGWKWGEQPRRLLTFALGGKASLPPSAPPDFSVHALDNPSFKPNPADVAAGHAMFIACAPCHGRDLVSTGAPGPDLRESRIALDPQALWTIVHDGGLMEKGMPRFAMLTHEQVMQIYSYIIATAREALTAAKTEDKHAANGH